MSRIIACISPNALGILLRSRVAKRLNVFYNQESALEVFDMLWETNKSFDMVVLERGNIDIDDLSIAVDTYLSTRFIIFDPSGRRLDIQRNNLSFVSTLDSLRQLLN